MRARKQAAMAFYRALLKGTKQGRWEAGTTTGAELRLVNRCTPALRSISAWKQEKRLYWGDGDWNDSRGLIVLCLHPVSLFTSVQSGCKTR